MMKKADGYSKKYRNAGGKAKTKAKSMGGHGMNPGHIGEVDVMSMDGGGVTKRDMMDCKKTKKKM